MRIIQADDAPQPIGPYSHAVAAEGRLLFLSGQIGINPTTGKLIEGGIAAETEQALDNIQAVLRECSLEWKDVVRMEMYILNMADFPVINTCYAKRFASGTFPARQVVQVAGLPGGAAIEIVCTAEFTSDSAGSKAGYR